MPEIISYHPSIRVSGTNESIKLGMDDWYDSEEILEKLSKLYSVKTIGELVQKIKSGLIPKQAVGEGVLTCDVGPCTEEHCTLEMDPTSKIT